MAEKLSKTAMKEMAQDALMHGIANVLGYWDPTDEGKQLTDEQRDELRQVMQQQADRIAKLFGYDNAWSN